MRKIASAITRFQSVVCGSSDAIALSVAPENFRISVPTRSDPWPSTEYVFNVIVLDNVLGIIMWIVKL